MERHAALLSQSSPAPGWCSRRIPWAPWSVLGSALILFTSYFQVQVSVAINSWYGPFYDLVQAALSKSKPVTVEQFYSELSTFAGIALVAVVVGVMTLFFVSHHIFRWRTAMNDFYIASWPQLRTIEGASQRCRRTPCGLRPPWKVSASI